MNFRPEMVLAIRRGRKTETRRIANDNPNSPWYRGDCGFEIGHVGGYAICPGRGRAAVGRLELTAEPRLDAIEAMDDAAARREGFDDLLAFRAYWERLHGRVEPLLKLWVVAFEPISWSASLKEIEAMVEVAA